MPACIVCVKFDSEEQSSIAPVTRSSEPEHPEYFQVTCARCGTYTIDRKLFLKGFNESTGIRLSGLIAEHTDGNPQTPLLLTPDTITDTLAAVSAPRRPSDYFDLVLVHLASLCKYPGQSTGQRQLARLAARAFLPQRAYRSLLEQLQAQGLLSIRSSDLLRFEVSLNPNGWQRVDDSVVRGQRQRRRAFVAMWFDRSMTPVYKDGIQPALLAAGFIPPFRVDDPEHDAAIDSPTYRPKIDDRILAEIRIAKFLVADVTEPRISVYFEAGFAEGLGIPVIWCCKKGREADMAFDTRQNTHILWDSAEDLRDQLLAKIRRHGWALDEPLAS